MKLEDTHTIEIDFTDFGALKELMKNHEKYSSSLVGENENHESVVIGIYADCIVTETLQNNGWTRKNVLWDDGTIEELYEKTAEYRRTENEIHRTL